MAADFQPWKLVERRVQGGQEKVGGPQVPLQAHGNEIKIPIFAGRDFWHEIENDEVINLRKVTWAQSVDHWFLFRAMRTQNRDKVSIGHTIENIGGHPNFGRWPQIRSTRLGVCRTLMLLCYNQLATHLLTYSSSSSYFISLSLKSQVAQWSLFVT